MRRRKRILSKVFAASLTGLGGVTLLLLFLSVRMLLQQKQFRSPVAQGFYGSEKVLASQDSLVSQVKTFLVTNHISYKTVVWKDNLIAADLTDGQMIIFSPQKDLLWQLGSLQLTLRQFTIEGKHFKRLDFRYDRPVIVF